jgi:uncharacterized phage protein (TIGR01671 family)
MKREIKFRVWDKKEKKMYSRIWAIHWYGYGELDKGIEVRETASTIKFEDADLLQYTGLQDKHGKEIYEGDIVKNCITGVRYEIKRDDYHRLADVQTYPDTFIVIGNRFENPKLLAT